VNLNVHQRAAVRSAILKLIMDDPHALADVLGTGPDAARGMAQLVLSTPTRKLSSIEQEVVRDEFGRRLPGVDTRTWFEEKARQLGCGHATVRRAVYRF
jgi:hypothetical protein